VSPSAPRPRLPATGQGSGRTTPREVNPRVEGAGGGAAQRQGASSTRAEGLVHAQQPRGEPHPVEHRLQARAHVRARLPSRLPRRCPPEARGVHGQHPVPRPE
jgi:hypothetical protein